MRRWLSSVRGCAGREGGSGGQAESEEAEECWEYLLNIKAQGGAGRGEGEEADKRTRYEGGQRKVGQERPGESWGDLAGRCRALMCR